MAKGDKIPSGVRYFDPQGRPDSTKGSKHPAKIGAGLETTKKLSGSPPQVPSGGSGSTHFPKRLSTADGTARLRGTSYKTVRGNVGRGPGGSGKLNSRTPSAVTKADGKRGKRNIKDPF